MVPPPSRASGPTPTPESSKRASGRPVVTSTGRTLQPLGVGRHDEHPNAAAVETGGHQSDVGVEPARDQDLGAVEHVSAAVVARTPATRR